MKLNSYNNFILLKDMLNNNILNKEIYESTLNELKNYDKCELNALTFYCSKKNSNRTCKISIFDNLSLDSLEYKIIINDDKYREITSIERMNDNYIYVYQNKNYGMLNYSVKKRLYCNNDLFYEGLLNEVSGKIYVKEMFINNGVGIKKINNIDKNEEVSYFRFKLDDDTKLNYDTRIYSNDNYGYTSKKIELSDYKLLSAPKRNNVIKLIKSL